MSSSSSDDTHGGKGSALRNFALLTLPWLAAQRDLLAAYKAYIKDENCALPVQNFALREMQALLMVFDTGRKLRDSCSEIESSIGEVYKKALPKFVSGSVALIEAQEAAVGSMIDALTRLKNESEKTNGEGG